MKGGALDLDIEPTTEGGKKNSREKGKTVKVCVLQEDPGDLRSLCSYIKRLHFNFRGHHFWARGYYVSTVGLDEAKVRSYIIKNQEEGDLWVILVDQVATHFSNRIALSWGGQ